MAGWMVNRLVRHDLLYGAQEAIPGVRDKFDIVRCLRLFCLHAGEPSTAGLDSHPAPPSAILGGVESR